MARRTTPVVVSLALVTAVCVVAWFGYGRYQEGRPHGGNEARSGAMQSASGRGYELTATEAKSLTDRLVSQDAATYRGAWAHGNMPPKAPPGTTIRVIGKMPATFPYEAGKIRAEMTIPSKTPVVVTLHLVRLHDKWLLVTMSER
jgi:hypothetical protein